MMDNDPKSSPEELIQAAKDRADNAVAEAEKNVKKLGDKLADQGRRLDAANAQIAKLEELLTSRERELKEAVSRMTFDPGAKFEVVTVRETPLGTARLPIGTVIGTISPIDGVTTDYLVDSVRASYTKCVTPVVDPGKKESSKKGGKAS